MLEQCCNHSKQCRNNVATLCCAKNRLCKSSRVTSPLQPAQLSHDHSFLNQHIYLKRDVFLSPLPYPSPPPHTHTQVFLFCFGFFSLPTSAHFTFVVQLNCGLSPKKLQHRLCHLVSSSGWTLVCRAGDRWFKPRWGQKSGSLNNWGDS